MMGKGKVMGSGSRLGIVLAALAMVLAAFPVGASALGTHSFLGSFCEPTGIGSAPCEPTFGLPAGGAVDEATGNVLVIDLEDHTLKRFKPNGEAAPFPALSGNVIDGHPGEEDATPEGEILSTEVPGIGGALETQVAVAPPGAGAGTAGDIYVTDAFNETIDIFESSGKFIGQISGAGYSCGVAVDHEGAVYVGDFFFGVHKFVPSAPATFGSPSDFEFPGTCQVAAGTQPLASGGSEGFIFPAAYQGPVAKLDSATGELDYIVRPGENTNVSVDPQTGHLNIASGSDVFEYDVSSPDEALLLSAIAPGGERVTGVAATGTGNVFITRAGNPQVEVWGPVELLPKPVTEAADLVGGESATLNGTVNPEGAPLTECFFEWGETQAYGNVAPCKDPNAVEVGEGGSPVPVHADISGLEPGAAYHFRLVAANANGSEVGEDETLLTLGASIKDEAASLITTNSARLTAKINPNGEQTTYFFQYVSQAQFEAEVNGGYTEAISLPSPPGDAGSGFGFIEVGQQLTGLSPDTTYVFRLVASTPGATHPGPDKTFTTHPISSNILPDGRAYELVTPPQKIGEVFPPESLGIWTGSCMNCLPGVTEEHMPMQARDDGEAVVYGGYPFTGGQASGPNEYLSERGAGGWGTQSLSPLLFASSEAQGYKAFSADLSRAIVYQIEPALTPDAPIGPEGKPYANLYLRTEGGGLTPLVTEAPPQRAADYENPDRFKIGFAAANAGTALVGALHNVVFEANDALTGASAVAPAAPTISAEERNLYEWVDGELRLVNVAPDNGAALSGTVFGSGRVLSEEKEGSGADFDGAVSEDGSRIFFSERATGQVYVRIDGEETREIQDHLGKFLIASGDGSKVLLSDGCLYDIETEACEDLTQGEGGFQGILGATDELSRIYFVDTEALAPGAEGGEPNLYDWNEGSIDFIATLLPSDNEFNGAVQPQVGDWMPSSSSRTAQVSPDGRFLAFMSRAPLTGYDNHVRGRDECRPAGPAACFEVFEYRADSEELICVSCNPSGERPLGTANLSLIGRGKNDDAKTGYPQPTNLTSNEGRIFFETQDNLTLGDSNGRIKDVYEWEPNGVGSCERANGCVYLISSGQGPNDSIFLDATPSGDDAFFITRDRLLPPDSDEKLDLYDARAPHLPGEAVGFPEAKTAPCQEEACKGPASAPPPAKDPQSAQVDGSGNVHQKHKKHHRKHHKKKHHKKHRHHRHGGHR
jgi:hypothetical protein